MNTIEIGNYIRNMRLREGLTQKELSDKLNISFQAVSKWETGVTLPDTQLLLELSDILGTTVDAILSAGVPRVRKGNRIDISMIKQGIEQLSFMKTYFGVKSSFYRGITEGINREMGLDIEVSLKDEYSRECLLAEAVIQLITEGNVVSVDEIKENFRSEKMTDTVLRYHKKYT